MNFSNFLFFKSFYLLCAISYPIYFYLNAEETTVVQSDVSITGGATMSNQNKMTARFINLINSTVYLWSYNGYISANVKEDPLMLTTIAFGK